MTDTITTTVVEHTITALGLTLERAQARLVTEEAEYVAKRDKMVEVAHKRGTDNSIGEALDDLLEEFGLPRRPERVTFRALVMVSAPMRNTGESTQTAQGTYIYPSEHHRVTWPVTIDQMQNVPQGDDCLCDHPEVSVRAWAPTYFGSTQAQHMTFQIGSAYCGGTNCPNRRGANYPDVSQVPSIDWTSLPTHKVVEETVAEEAPSPNTGEPQVGQTWYLVGRNTYGASNEDGDPIIINSTEGRERYGCRRPSDPEGTSRYVFLRPHLRATPDA